MPTVNTIFLAEASGNSKLYVFEVDRLKKPRVSISFCSASSGHGNLGGREGGFSFSLLEKVADCFHDLHTAEKLIN